MYVSGGRICHFRYRQREDADCRKDRRTSVHWHRSPGKPGCVLPLEGGLDCEQTRADGGNGEVILALPSSFLQIRAAEVFRTRPVYMPWSCLGSAQFFSSFSFSSGNDLVFAEPYPFNLGKAKFSFVFCIGRS